jgi:hypothetical protein
MNSQILQETWKLAFKALIISGELLRMKKTYTEFASFNNVLLTNIVSPWTTRFTLKSGSIAFFTL